MQLAATVALGAFVGRYLDGWLALERPYFTALLCVLFGAAALYLVYRQLAEDDRREKL